MQLFLKNAAAKEPTATEKKKQATCFQQLAAALEFNPSQQFELRFHNLDYPLIEKLQSVSLTDKTLTQKNKASIRIVLGTVGGFASKEHLARRCV